MPKWLSAALVVLAFLAGPPGFCAPPPQPYIEKDACPFEGCQFGRWVVRSPMRAYRSERSGSPVAFRIQPGDTILALRGNLHVERTGLVVVTSPGAGFATGDTLFVLGYGGEGLYSIWYNGEVRSADAFWLGSDVGEPTGRLIRPVRMIWWVNVKDQLGRVGWLRLVNRTSEGFDFKEQIDGISREE